MRTFSLTIFAVIGFFSFFSVTEEASSIQMQSLWMFADFTMTLAQFDADPVASQLAIISAIQCVLRIPKHVILFNYRSSAGTGTVRASVQVLADTTNIKLEKRDQVGQALISAYQTALNKAREEGNFVPFLDFPLIGLNMMEMQSWVSLRTITVVPSDSLDFSRCPPNIDYSGMVETTFTTLMDDKTFDYFAVTSSGESDPQTLPQPLKGRLLYSSLVEIFILAMMYILT